MIPTSFGTGTYRASRSPAEAANENAGVSPAAGARGRYPGYGRPRDAFPYLARRPADQAGGARHGRRRHDRARAEMTEAVMVRMRHLRQARWCAAGVRAWLTHHGF